MRQLVRIEQQSNSLQSPMRGVFLCEQVRLEHETHSHSIPPVGSDVDRCHKSVEQFQSMGFHRDYVQDRQLLDQSFGGRPSETHLVLVPDGALQVQSLDIAA